MYRSMTTACNLSVCVHMALVHLWLAAFILAAAAVVAAAACLLLFQQFIKTFLHNVILSFARYDTPMPLAKQRNKRIEFQFIQEFLSSQIEYFLITGKK